MPNPLTLGIAKIGDLLLHNRITQVEGAQGITDIVLTFLNTKDFMTLT